MNSSLQHKSQFNNDAEGVIKFQLHHQSGSVEITRERLAQLNTWRLLMYRLLMLGQDDQRYDGLAFGNVSHRQNRASQAFYISGTQTSGKELLQSSDICLVTAAELSANNLYAKGEVKPSSEALTHASVYQNKASVQAVIHVHSPEIWQHTDALNLPFTPENVAYGTPDMALAVADLLHNRILEPFGLFTMLGHLDGIVAFGESLEVTAELIIQAWSRAQQLTLNA